MTASLEEDVLRALRRITRSIDLHSRKLATTFGLTAPQLVCLRVVGQMGCVTPSTIAREMALSQATVTGILDRLVARQLCARMRSDRDRRLVMIELTDAGRALLDQAPSPLQERFKAQLAQLGAEDQERIRSTLLQIVAMMGGEDLEAAPILSSTTHASDDELDARAGGTESGTVADGEPPAV